MHHITVVLLAQSLGSSISLPVEMLSAANELARSKNRQLHRLHIDMAALTSGPVKTAAGLSINSTARLQDIEHTDLVIVPALWRDPLRVLRSHSALLPWLTARAAQSTLICAVGTSSAFLAEAGLLDGKPATTHWHFCDSFARRYPKVKLKRDYLLTQADNLYCAGSVNSVADLTVHLVEKLYGQAIARAVEGQFSPEIRRPFESHAYTQHASGLHRDETIIDAQEWLRAHYAETVIVSQLAQNLGLSERTFSRRFKKAAGVSPSAYLQNLRLNTAKDLLRTSNLSVADIAASCGYQDNSYFCLRFKQLMAQTPLAYRKSVRGKLFTLL